MELQVLGSSSAGNCYLLHLENGGVVVLDCGVRFAKVKQAIGFDARRVKLVLMSHWHGDHSKYLQEFLDAGIEVFGPDKAGFHHYRYGTLANRGSVERGGVQARAFEVKHDVTCYAYMIEADGQTLMYVTDTALFPYKAANVNHWLMEANYSEDVVIQRVMDGSINSAKIDRVRESHMELETAISAVVRSLSENTRSVTLIHLSSDNSNEEHFKLRFQQATGVPVRVADAGKRMVL